MGASVTSNELLELIKWIIGVVGAGAFSLLWREIQATKTGIARVWAEIDKMKEDTATHRVLVAQQYVTRTDFADLRREMKEGFTELAKLIRRDKGSE